MVMQKKMWLVALLAAAAMLLAGCGDDTGSAEENDTSTVSDVTSDTTTAGTDTTTAGADTTTAGTDTTPVVEVPFAWPATPAEYQTGSVGYIYELIIPPLDDDKVPTCCYDWGTSSKDYIVEETNNMDNALAKLADMLIGFDMDLQAMMTDELKAGTFTILWDHQEFNGAPTDDDGFILAGLFGEFANGTTWDTARAGTGEFTISPTSFTGTTGEPLINFNPASMQAGTMMAGPAVFFLTFPLGTVTLDVLVSDTMLDGTAAISDTGMDYKDGTLSGYILFTDLLEAINLYVASDACSCLNIETLYYVDGEGKINTDACLKTEGDAQALCPSVEEETCVTLASGLYCPMIPGLIEGSADIDLDGDCALDPMDCTYEALSVGLEWSAVPATVVK